MNANYLLGLKLNREYREYDEELDSDITINEEED